MAKRKLKKERGIFERPKGSGVWWINYYQDGQQHREKAGTRQDAKDLYKIRKAAILKGEKLPDLKNNRPTLSSLIDDALVYAKAHNSRPRDYESKAGIVKEALGRRIAASITPSEIDAWLEERFNTPATKNRYRAFLSLVYKQAIINRKVDINPARLVRQRKEPPGRTRFLSYQEYFQLLKLIEEHRPEHREEFITSVHSGMRLTEQYTVTWDQVSFDRKTIELTKTKNGSGRTVHLDEEALEAIKAMRRPGQKRNAIVFPNSKQDFDNGDWFDPLLDDAGIDDYTWHSNRHTFCSWLALNGATLKEIQEAAGHKTIQMSAKYAHLSPKHNEGVVNRITAALQAASKVA